MSIEPPSFEIGNAILQWVLAVLACTLIAILVGLAGSLSTNGKNGPKVFWRTLKQGLRDLTGISLQRVGALASLTMKEAISRKTFVIGFLFLVLFMFAGWFLGSDAEKPALPYITFVMSAMYFLLSLIAILISCWGLPADIKAKSLHTVVTKPVRRSEIVIGRILGYSSVVLLVLAVTSIFGYVWIQRQVPESAKSQLVARVPIYGDLSFISKTGEVNQKAGLNVGDVWDYRSYIEGLTKARAVWTFNNLNVSQLKQSGELRLEQKFEAFRTYKGDINEQTRYSLTLVNSNKGLRVPLPDTFPVQEYKDDPELAVMVIPETIEYIASYEEDAPETKANLFDDIFNGNSLTIEVACVDNQQYIGCARGDLFIRMKDKSFLTSYVKANIGLALMLVLIVSIGTTSSCFLKGPVSTLLTGTMIILGNIVYEFIGQAKEQLTTSGKVLGGGVLESVYRIVTGMNQTTPLPDNLGVGKMIIEKLDSTVFNVLFLVQAAIPDFTYFNMNEYTANGFDVPWAGALLPSILITIGFILPLIILGYFSLQLRELESK